MGDVRYQVFVSSTFRDLVQERQAVLDAIHQLNHFPVGMEAFPASGGTPWNLIQQMIEQSDYYVLIIAGRYGAVTADGISYTEAEYDHACRTGKTVLAFLHEAPEDLAFSRVESSEDARASLHRFRERVKNAHLCKMWREKDQLALYVTTSLLTAIRTNPATGWVRGDAALQAQALFDEVVDLRRRYEDLLEENRELRRRAGADTDAFVEYSGDEPITVTFDFDSTHKAERVTLMADQIFFALGDVLLTPASEYKISSELNRVVGDAFAGTERFNALTRHSTDKAWYRDKCRVTETSVRDSMYALMRAGLVQPETFNRTSSDDRGRTFSHLERAWTLTKAGRRRFLAARPARSEAG